MEWQKTSHATVPLRRGCRPSGRWRGCRERRSPSWSSSQRSPPPPAGTTKPNNKYEKKHYSGFGSVRFWASLIQIRHYLYGSGYGSFHYRVESKKNVDLSFLWLLYDILTLKNDLNESSKRNKQKTYGMVPRKRIRTKMSRIHNTDQKIRLKHIKAR